MKTALVTLAFGSLALLVGTFAYRALAGRRLRRRYRLDNVSEQWLMERRRDN